MSETPAITEDMLRSEQQRYRLKLYVTELTASLRRTVDMLQRICEDDTNGCYELEVIDIREHPNLAEDERILAVPTLIRELPPPIRRIIGDLSDREKVILGLDLQR